MTEADSAKTTMAFVRSLRTARSVAIAGIVSAVTLTLTLYLYRSAFPFDELLAAPQQPSAESVARGRLALSLMPYFGIFFIWFMGAVNYNLRRSDDRLFTTVFLASGILFVGVSFVAGAMGAAELAALSEGLDRTPQERIVPGLAVNELLINYGARMAAIFCLALSTLGRLRRMLPAWLSWLGTATGVFLLLVPFGVPHVQYVFPAWITILSLYLFVTNPGEKSLALGGA